MRRKNKIKQFFLETLDRQDCDTRKIVNVLLRQLASACFEYLAETNMDVSEFLVARN